MLVHVCATHFATIDCPVCGVIPSSAVVMPPQPSWDDGSGATVRNIEIADVDGDGKPDIVALGRSGASSHESARVAVLALVDGKLVERASTTWKHGEYTHGYGLAVADLDGDKKPEIVTAGFQSDGKTEQGHVEVWRFQGNELRKGAEITPGQAPTGAPSMRINDLAIGDLDGDGKPEIIVAGRHGPLKTDDSKSHLDQRHEEGDLRVYALRGNMLANVATYSWSKGASLRIRSAVALGRNIVVGGQFDADGKPCLGLFALDHGKLVLRDGHHVRARSREVKDLIVAGDRVIATGPIGEKPGRQGDVTAWRVVDSKLVADGAMVSRNGDETRARAVIATPEGRLITIGHAKTGSTMVGQVLAWDVVRKR